MQTKRRSAMIDIRSLLWIISCCCGAIKTTEVVSVTANCSLVLVYKIWNSLFQWLFRAPQKLFKMCLITWIIRQSYVLIFICRLTGRNVLSHFLRSILISMAISYDPFVSDSEWSDSGDSASNTCPHPVYHIRVDICLTGIDLYIMVQIYWVEKIICEKQQFSWKERATFIIVIVRKVLSYCLVF